MKSMRQIALALLTGAALTASAPAALARAPAATLEGTVTRVIDGDSLLLQAPGAPPVEIRLLGIDAPEGCQPGGPQAREALAEYVLDKAVTARTQGRDHYGRTLATLTVDGLNVNQRMVAEGQAWSSRAKWNRGPFVAQEKMAQALKRGLHASPGALMPAEFRRRNGPCQRPEGAAVSASAAAAPAAAAALPAAEPALQGPMAAFRCDGRTHCSQMRSCAEATYFLQHCPGVKMDGNRDGVPCERQWCR